LDHGIVDLVGFVLQRPVARLSLLALVAFPC
jgi:hypothetical protein